MAEKSKFPDCEFHTKVFAILDTPAPKEFELVTLADIQEKKIEKKKIMYGQRFALLATTVIFVIGTSTCQAKEKSVIEYLGTTYIMPDGCPTPDCDMSDPECVRTKR